LVELDEGSVFMHFRAVVISRVFDRVVVGVGVGPIRFLMVGSASKATIVAAMVVATIAVIIVLMI
jgi:hypothetical protein